MIPNTQMELIKVSQTKITELQLLCKKVYTKHFADHWEKDGLAIFLEDQFGTKRLEADLTNPDIDYCFICVNQQPVGFLKINYEANLAAFKNIKTAELEKIYILPEWNGKGVGQWALKETIAKIRQRHKALVFLYVIDTNTSSIGFYEKVGFRFYLKTRLELVHFKEELRGLNLMILKLD